MKITLAQVSVFGLLASASASALAQAPVSVSLDAPFLAYIVASDALLSTALTEPEWQALQLLDSSLVDLVIVRPDCE